MKILYVGDLQNGATSAMRKHCLQNLGHQVWGIDTSGTARTDGILLRGISKIAWRLGWPLDLSNINNRLLALVKETQPDIVWVDKGMLLSKETLLRIKQSVPTIRLVHYNPDDPFGAYGKAGWRRFLCAISTYDVHFVPRQQNIQEYIAAGCRHVIHNTPARGFDPTIHQPYVVKTKFAGSFAKDAGFLGSFEQDQDMAKGCHHIIHNIPMWGFDTNVHRTYLVEAKFIGQFAADVGFLGSFEQDRADHLLYLAQRGVAVRLASTWPAHHRHQNLHRAPFPVVGIEYAKALCCFKIGLCFLRKANRDQHTSRSIEIPACGVFLLAERTEEHQKLFEEGREAEFFSTPEELYDKVRFYLANDAARIAIARAGRERCIRSGYDYENRMRAMLAEVASTIGIPKCADPFHP